MSNISRSVPVGLGRCRCLFHPCSTSPYRTSTESCFELAFQVEEENCHKGCMWSGPEACQECIQENLPDQCNELSGAPCWHCSSNIYKENELCKANPMYQSGMEVVQCVRDKQITAGCDACVCTMLCYWEPGSAECRACLEDGQAAEMFLHRDTCQQGWLLSREDARCYKGFRQEKTWAEAVASCSEEGGVLAEPTTTTSIYTVIEAMNVHGIGGELGCWVGGRRNDSAGDFHWNVAESNIAMAAWAHDFPSPISNNSCMHQSSSDGFFRNRECSDRIPYVCQKKKHVLSRLLQLSQATVSITASTTTTPSLTTTTTATQSTATCNCGIAQKETRIVGGIETEVNKYPWKVISCK